MDESLTTTEKRLIATYLACGNVSKRELVSTTNINSTYARKCLDSMEERGMLYSEGGIIQW